MPMIGAEQLVNAASLPRIVGKHGEWQIGILVRLTYRRSDCNRYRIWRFRRCYFTRRRWIRINCGVRVLALDATIDDVPNIKKLAGRIAGRIPAGASGKGGLEIKMKDLDELILGGAQSAAELGIGYFEI